jgi:hypothetical protein
LPSSTDHLEGKRAAINLNSNNEWFPSYATGGDRRQKQSHSSSIIDKSFGHAFIIDFSKSEAQVATYASKATLNEIQRRLQRCKVRYPCFKTRRLPPRHKQGQARAGKLHSGEANPPAKNEWHSSTSVWRFDLLVQST